MNAFVRVVASFFYVGYLPKMPGTWGSLAGLALAWLLAPSLLIYSTLMLSILGLMISERSRGVFGQDDPSHFVLDEVCGMMISVLWLPKIWPVALGAFVLFRLLDVWKPGPIGWIQKQKSASSIMWDDIAAGVVANLLLRGALLFSH